MLCLESDEQVIPRIWQLERLSSCSYYVCYKISARICVSVQTIFTMYLLSGGPQFIRYMTKKVLLYLQRSVEQMFNDAENVVCNNKYSVQLQYSLYWDRTEAAYITYVYSLDRKSGALYMIYGEDECCGC